jgi:hypothetical protein
MHPIPAPIISAHRFTRLVLWLEGVLAWFALGCPARNAAERRHHARLGGLSRTRLIHTVRNVIIIRAAEIVALKRSFRTSGRRPLNVAPGFRRAPFGNLLRSVGGVWLRRKLKVRGGIVAQALHLLAVLRQLHAIAVRFARLRRHGLTRPRAIICCAPRADAVFDLVAPPMRADDTS